MKVLVTGGAGFVGRHLLARLARDGVEVVYTTTRETGPSSPPGRALRLTLPDRAGLARVLGVEAPGAVIHLAGMSSVPEAQKDPRGAVRSNVEGTLSLLDALDEVDPGGRIPLVHVSTSQVYAPARDERPLDEEAPLGPRSTYARTKLAAELLVGACAVPAGRPWVAFRPWNHIGPGQRSDFAVASFARQIARIEEGSVSPVLRVGDLQLRRDFTDVRDIAAAYAAALTRPLPCAAINLASGRARALAEIIEALRARARKPFEVVVAPELLRPDEARLLVGDAARARALLGWEPSIPLETTIEDILAAARKELS